MSLTGNNYYGGQNLENTHPLSNIGDDITSMKIDILQNTDDIGLNILAIDEASTLILQNETDITTNTNSISTIKQKTDRMVLEGSVLTYPITSSSIKFNQHLNLNSFSLTNVGVNSFSGWGGGGEIYIRNSSTMAIYANLTGNDTTGSVFEFRSIKSGAYTSAKLSAVDFDFNNRTLSNCPTITTIQGINTTQTADILTNTTAIDDASLLILQTKLTSQILNIKQID
jgi:hypothetical protein